MTFLIVKVLSFLFMLANAYKSCQLVLILFQFLLLLRLDWQMGSNDILKNFNYIIGNIGWKFSQKFGLVNTLINGYDR